MHDIVKAVGNCSYNQLVEKIISCKQSDNSELAGEGKCFLFSPDLPDCSSLPFLLFWSCVLEAGEKREKLYILVK